MSQARQLWDGWQALLVAFTTVFTRPGWVRFVQWVTGMVLCWEEHTLTQILTALGLEARWRVLERFAEYGAWDREAVERQMLRLIEQERPARWGRYHPVALDDTKLHRTSAKVWGTCTFHESSARSPESGGDGPSPQLGRHGRFGTGHPMDVSAPCGAAVLSEKPVASRRDLSDQNGLGGGAVAASGCGVERADLGGV